MALLPPETVQSTPVPAHTMHSTHAGASARSQHRSLVRPCAFPFSFERERPSRRPRKPRAYSGQALTLSRAVARRQVWPPGSVHAAVNRLAKSSPANLHAALWFELTSVRCGSAAAQSFTARGHRVLKKQPDGGFVGLGISPLIRVGFYGAPLPDQLREPRRPRHATTSSTLSGRWRAREGEWR